MSKSRNQVDGQRQYKGIEPEGNEPVEQGNTPDCPRNDLNIRYLEGHSDDEGKERRSQYSQACFRKELQASGVYFSAVAESS